MSTTFRALGLSALALMGCGSVKVGPPQPGELIGQVEVSQDVPAASCIVLLEGTPLGGPCDETGGFDVRNVPPGRWDLRIVTDGAATALPAKRVAAASNPGMVSDLGALRLAQPGSIGGHVRSSGQDLSLAIITVPEIGAVTVPNPNGGYLLDGVSPGIHDVVLLTDAGTVVHSNITVLPGKVTIGADLDVSALQAATAPVTGRALRADAGDGGHAGLTVELVETVDGHVVTSATTTADGAYQLQARQGTFLVRARDGSNPLTAILPSVVVKGPAPIAFSTALVVHPQDGDLNGNGVPNGTDPDIDGDGVPNAMDAFPYDPAETRDTDSDGVGDRSDLKSMGGTGIDHHNDTPDTDGDGKLDFEDNCPKVPNPDQKDTDGDGVGDACDDCPFVANPDQKDSVGNGIGDACRACKTNQDCPGGRLCNFGQCLACISNAQCGDEVCDPATGSCRACAAASDCTAPRKCNGVHRCVDCLMTTDCPANMACVAGGCFPQCTSDANCPGQFCVAGACAACRGNGDCPATEWCDAGQCKPQCTVDGDCTGGRKCDMVTRTCQLPCSGMCNNMQTCVSSACRDVCDASKPCTAGFKCASGACVPECAVDNDCLTVRPFTVCQAGACVSNGHCSLDSECSNAQLCVSGTCANRTGTLVAGKGYTCAQPCDCKLGETCSVNAGDGMTYCTADLQPKWFVAAACSGGTCDGSSPNQPSTNLTTVMSSAKAGDTVAVRAGDSFPGQTIALPNQALIGGFRICTSNRWVRDNTQRSTLTGAVSIPGTNSVPLPGVTVANFNVSSGANVIDAAFASNLTLSELTVSTTAAPSATLTYAGVSCATCSNVSFSDIDMPGFDATAGTFNVTLIKLTTASGTLTRMRNGKFLGASFSTIAVTNTTGAITVDGTQSDGTAQLSGGAGVSIVNATGGMVTVKNSQIGFASSSGTGNAGEWDGIYVQGAPTMSLTNNTIDGRGVTEVSSGGNQAERDGIRVEASNGTLSGNTVYFSNAFNAAQMTGYRILGPQGTITFSNNNSSLGNQNNHNITNLDIESVSSGSILIQKCNLQAGQGSSSIGLRYYRNGATFLITDSTFVAADGSGGVSYGAYVDTGVGRFERCIFKGEGARGATNGIYSVTSQLELYDSYLYAGGSGSSYTVALYPDSTTTLFGVNNTLDPGGSPGSGAPSYGVFCPNTSTAVMTNNLINGGNSQAPYRLADNGAHTCFNGGAAAWSHNYLWYSSSSTPNGNDQASLFMGMNGNLVAGNATCYDSNFLQPDYHIGATSPCVDQGAAAKRKDGTTMTVDLDGNARTQGAAADIGCHEAK